MASSTPPTNHIHVMHLVRIADRINNVAEIASDIRHAYQTILREDIPPHERQIMQNELTRDTVTIDDILKKIYSDAVKCITDNCPDHPTTSMPTPRPTRRVERPPVPTTVTTTTDPLPPSSPSPNDGEVLCSEARLHTLTEDELRAMLRAMNEDESGNRGQLITRIQVIRCRDDPHSSSVSATSPSDEAPDDDREIISISSSSPASASMARSVPTAEKS